MQGVEEGGRVDYDGESWRADPVTETSRSPSEAAGAHDRLTTSVRV